MPVADGFQLIRWERRSEASGWRELVRELAGIPSLALGGIRTTGDGDGGRCLDEIPPTQAWLQFRPS
ncbi:MAG: hypothetical protein WC485_00590, partial [Opitutaceae bacterium]